VALVAVVAVVGTGGAVVFGAGGGVEDGRIGPETDIQPSGRDLNPAGKTTKLGNMPTGGGLTRNGKFLWTLSAGRGANDVRIVRVLPTGKCKPGERGCRGHRG